MRFFSLIVLFLLAWGPTNISAYRHYSPSVNGHLELAYAPRVGENTTLILSIDSNLNKNIVCQVLFRLPRGITPQSPDAFDYVYLPTRSDTEFRVSFLVDKPGQYPLQASIYFTDLYNRPVAEHFYLYLRSSTASAEVLTYPPDRFSGGDILQSRVKQRHWAEQIGQVNVHGKVSYFNDNEKIEKPIQNSKVILYNNQIIVAETYADDQGSYFFNDLPGLDKDQIPNLVVGVRFSNDLLSISDRRKKIYEIRSEIIQNVEEGEVVIDVVLDDRNPNRALGNIYDAIQRAHNFFLNRLGWSRDHIRVVWPDSGRFSYYYANQFGGKITGEEIRIAAGVDQWRNVTMYHEYGHSVMMAAYDYQYEQVPRGNHQMPHRLETVSDLEFAFSEGWAEFCEAAVDDRALNVTGRWGEATPNIEANNWWTGSNNGKGQNKDGSVVEGTIASILWDVFDTSDSIDMTLGIDDDNIDDKFDLVWRILVERRPKNIIGIAVAWQELGFPEILNLKEIYKVHHTPPRPNTSPEFKFVIPTDNAISDKSFKVDWQAQDPEGDDFTIDLYYYNDSLNDQFAKLITKNITSDTKSYTWQTIFIKDGKYHLRSVTTDSHGGVSTVNSAKYVIVDHTPLQPPQISSTTHPKSDRWYSSDSPKMDLVTIPENQNGRKYSFVLDHRPKNIPDNFPDLMVKNNKLKFSGLNDGIWWVHVRAKDQLGYWTETSHFEFRIDSSPPKMVSNISWETSNNQITLKWKPVKDLSGIAIYHVQIDTDTRIFLDLIVDEQIDGSKTNYSFVGKHERNYYGRIKAINNAQLESRSWSRITPAIQLPVFLKWDINHDGIVDITDLVLVAKDFGNRINQGFNGKSDVNTDGIVDLFDLILVASKFSNPNAVALASKLIDQVLAQVEEFHPAKSRLLPNYPNPFNPDTWIPFDVAILADISMLIYSLDGQIVRQIELGSKSAGSYRTRDRAAYWSGRNLNGDIVASGMYFVMLRVNGIHTDRQKIVIKK